MNHYGCMNDKAKKATYLGNNVFRSKRRIEDQLSGWTRRLRPPLLDTFPEQI